MSLPSSIHHVRPADGVLLHVDPTVRDRNPLSRAHSIPCKNSKSTLGFFGRMVLDCLATSTPLVVSLSTTQCAFCRTPLRGGDRSLGPRRRLMDVHAREHPAYTIDGQMLTNDPPNVPPACTTFGLFILSRFRHVKIILHDYTVSAESVKQWRLLKS